MKMSEPVLAHYRVSLNFDRDSRRILVRASTGNASEMVVDGDVEAAILDRLVRISPTGVRLAANHAARQPLIQGPFPARSPRTKDIELLGAVLGSFLFGGTIGREVREQLHGAREHGQRLVVHVAIEDPFLRLLPWETAILPDVGRASGPACWCPDLAVVRRDGEAPARSLAMAGTLQVLMIIDDPEYFEADAWSLRRSVQNSTRNVHIAEPLVALPWSDVSARLANRDLNWHVLIYAGHVSTSEGLSFRGEIVPCEDFVDRTLSANDDLRCVTLMGCSTWEVVAKRFLEMGLPAVLGTNFYMPTGLPRIGLEPFLSELARSGRVDEAFALLKRALPREHQATPVLCVGSDDMRLFTIGSPTMSLGDYMRAIRNQLDRLELLGLSNEGLREELYQQRKLRAPEVASKQPRSDSQARGFSPPKSQRQVLTEILRPAAGHKLCLTGEAGSGKSTMLDHLAWELAKRYLHDPDVEPRRIPFRINLSSWQTEHPGTLKDMIIASANQLDETIMDEILESGSAVLLLDGLDEVGPTLRVHLIEWIDAQIQAESVRHNAVVLASRPWAVSHTALRRFRTNRLALVDLGRRDIETYIHRYYGEPDHARRVARQIASAAATFDMAKRPLFLMLLCFVGEQGGTTLPATEGQLLETALRQLLERRGLPREASLRLLANLAWICWHEETAEVIEHRAQQLIVEMMRDDPLVDAAKWEAP